MPPPTVPGIPKSPSVPLNPCLITKFANRGIGTPHSTFNFKLFCEDKILISFSFDKLIIGVEINPSLKITFEIFPKT